MSIQPDAIPTSDTADTHPHDANPATDAGFELLDESEGAQTPETEDDEYWYADDEEASPIGPVALAVIRKQVATGTLQANGWVWRHGMSQWSRLADHLDLRQYTNPDHGISRPPPLPRASGAVISSRLCALLGSWAPSAFVYRLVARCVLALGLLTLLISLLLLPIGVSWFSGGLLIVLIAVVLELAAVIREVFQPTTQTRPNATNPRENTELR